ncbi:MAG TPA: hypothetical protein VD887_06595 [Allosphingosinicella sp.]|nr:hypothetical protein [Allosphingosinicella sp.]
MSTPTKSYLCEAVSPRRIFVANFGRENFEWPGCLAGGYIATMQDERAHAYWETGDREGFVQFSIKHLKTAKGLPPTAAVASRWFNLGSIIVESQNDLWLHKQGDLLWWTVTTDAAASINREPDPSARSGEPENGIFYRKPAQPWRNTNVFGNRLEWKALHPKSHDFFTTEATLQQLGPDYSGFALALVNGEDLTPWTHRKEWEDKAASRRGNTGGRVFNRREIAVAMMVRRAMSTAARSNAQQELRRVKNKEVRFASQREFEEYVDALISAQEGLCALSEIALQFDEREDLDLCCSLDRIESDGHYERGNLQVVCRFINRWKSDAVDGDFRRLLNLVRTA